MSCALDDLSVDTEVPVAAGVDVPEAAGDCVLNHAIKLSLNEIKSLCTNAARGAGMSWGLAEEAGYASVWLAAHGLDGAGLLCKQLVDFQSSRRQNGCPVIEPGQWRAAKENETLCPIAVGASLSDHICCNSALFDGDGLEIGEIGFPALLLPFIAMTAEALSKPVVLQIENSNAVVSPEGKFSEDVLGFLTIKRAVVNVIEQKLPWNQNFTGVQAIQASMNKAMTTEISHASPHTDQLVILNQLAMKTTVLASASSRANAGASGSDSD